MERRYVSAGDSPVQIETRADGRRSIVGYASVFFNPNEPGTQYELYPGVSERVMPTAFTRAIAEKDDCRALVNHDPSLLLGRTAAGTCRLSVDSRGLRYEIDPPDTQAARDALVSIARGDMTGSSFGFDIERQSWREAGPMVVRELDSVRLLDVSVVSFPAYAAAGCAVRVVGDIGEVRCACEAWKAGRDSRGAVTFRRGPMIDDAWDEDAARGRVRSWAHAGDRMDYARYARAFGYRDGSASEAGHLLLHHDVRDGKLVTSRAGVEACLRALDSEDGGGVPESDRAAVRSHLERHAAPQDGDDAEPDDDPDDDGRAKIWVPGADVLRMRTRLAEAQ